MRIILYTLNYSPELIGIGKYNSELVDWFISRGHEVQVICAPPYYPEWKVRSGYSAWKYGKEASHGLTIFRCPVWVPRVPSGLKRIFHLLSFALSSAIVLLRQASIFRPDLIFIVEPPIFCLPAALLVSKLYRSKVWLHIQDFEIDAGFSLGIVPGLVWIRKAICFAEHLLLMQTSAISVISYGMQRHLCAKGIPAKKSYLFPNWVDTSAIHPYRHSNCFRELLNLRAEQIVCLYSGNLGSKQGLDILVDTARSLQNQPVITFVIAGDGPQKKALAAKARGLQNIHFLKLQPISKFNDLLNLADIHLLPQSSKVADLVMPSKIKAIFASGRPVIATASRGTELEQTVQGHGIVLSHHDVNQWVKAIQYLANDPSARESLGREARNYAIAHWQRDQVLSSLERTIMGFLYQKRFQVKS